MSAPTTSGKKAPMPPAYRHFAEFTERWLLPTINVRLAEAARENTYTWCGKWWAHRSVAVRFAHLHSAFEAQRRARTGNSLSTFLLSHVDPHMRYILDAANGPLHRCTRNTHLPTPSPPFEPVPAGWFASANNSPGSGPESDKQQAKGPPPRFAHYSLFVQNWLLPVTAVRITGSNREGQYSWCRQWWRHQAVAVRFAGLHSVFEAALHAEDKSAMSGLFVRHVDPHMRYILDAANGPLHRCTLDQHVDIPGLPAEPIPAAWFGAPGAKTAVEHLGFGPDFRAFANGAAEGLGL
ncbi:DUF4913 domain-containing protein [Nocardia sp. NPDC051990]|uniref:DUF4913 domain-containing protein n=1 Tax=Nocardia sp. NPDC051990 TaxID=3155285 RepID=UPI0034363B3A